MKYNITWDLSHCSVTPNDTSLEAGTHTWTFKADDGYYFDETGGIFDDNLPAYGDEIPATKTDTTTLTYDLQRDITIGLTASLEEKPIEKYNITWDLTNCSVTPNDTILEAGIHTWTFKANSGYYFDETGGILDNNQPSYGDEIPATGSDTTTLTYDLQRDINVSLSASIKKITTIAIKQNLTNATSNVNGVEVDRKINQIIITANTGYQFKDDILIQLFTGDNIIQSFSVAGASGTTVNIPFNTNTQNTITDTITNIVITAVAVKPETSTGYAHYYAITKTELNKFSNERIWSTPDDTYDVSKYIDNLIELPFKYDTTELTTNKIAVGRIATATTSHEINNRFYTLDFGTITVPSKYKNGYDYQVRTCKLYLPFAPSVSIDINNAMEQTIHIVYQIDISTGNATITLDNNGIAFNTLNVVIADNIPFLNTLKNTVIKDGQHQIYNGIRNPYLIITRNKPVLDNDYYPTREQNKISSYQGRITARLLDNPGITDNEDMEEIENILSNGVIYTKEDNGRNLIQMANTTAGYVDGRTGNIATADSTSLERVTDFIEVEPNQTYWMQNEVYLLTGQYLWFGVGVYDVNKTFIDRQTVSGELVTSNGTVFDKLKMVMPDNAKYVRASFSTYGNARVKFEKGSVATPYSHAHEDVM